MDEETKVRSGRGIKIEMTFTAIVFDAGGAADDVVSKDDHSDDHFKLTKT